MNAKQEARWMRSALAAGIVALVCNAMAWALFLKFTPVRPSVVRGFQSAGMVGLLLAIVLGVMAALRRGQRPARRWVGAVAFVVLLMPSCLMFTLLSGPAGESVDYQWTAAPESHVREVMRGARAYADEHGTFAHSLKELVAAGQVKAEALRDPVTGDVFEYRGEALPAEASDAVIVLNTRDVAEREGRWAGFGDGHSEFVPSGEWAKRVAASEAERATMTMRGATSAP